MSNLSHFDDTGASRMVDVSGKSESQRIAKASAVVQMKSETLALIRDRNAEKGDVREVARLAGIMAAKHTATLIPLCHPLPLTSVTIDFAFDNEEKLLITSTVKTISRTGVEMEALTAVSIAALTVYDMLKSVDREMRILEICLEAKSGGSRDDYQRM